MYHYVRPDDPGLPHFRHLHVEDFARQLDYFAAHQGFVSRSAWQESLALEVPTTPGVLLTFDDGFKDHVTFVLPELERRGLWGLFYIPTAPLVTGRLLDVHRIHWLLGRLGGVAVLEALGALGEDAWLQPEYVAAFRATTYRRQVNDTATAVVKRTLNYYLDSHHRREVLDRLMALHCLDEAALAKALYLDVADLRRLVAAGMVVGSHTHSHPVLSTLPDVQQAHEIQASFAWLEAQLGALTPKSFCYPYGGFHTFTPTTEALLEGVGCQFAFNVEPRDIEAADLRRRQAMPRFDCNAFPFGQCRGVGAP